MSRSSFELMGTPDELFHWIPGEMVVLVRLPRRLTNNEVDTLTEQVLHRLNAFLARYELVLDIYGTAGRWSDIPTMPPIRRRAFLFGARWRQPCIALFFHVRSTATPDIDAMPMALSYLHAHVRQLAQEGLRIVSAMPNWLVTAAPTWYEDGGPAFPPRPAPGLDVPGASTSQVGWHVTLEDPTIPLDRNGAEGVVVAVLDTAHHPDRLRSAATRPELRRNWLLHRLNTNLRSDNSSFSIEFDRYPVINDARTGRDAYDEPRYYFMPDHGLFVAGLIRDIAPRARIRLIRILNDFGGCDLYNLFAALTDLEHELASGNLPRLVINLSLTVTPDVQRLPFVWFDHRQWQTGQLPGVIRLVQFLEEGLRLLFDSLRDHGALIVAAAGNDSASEARKGRGPRPPRAPARYDSILSVTSVNSRAQPSQFANAAGVFPGSTGVATLGGDGSELIDVNALPDAVRGLYISPTFPQGQQNTTGWADWSGTSFSTAIVSAVSAHLLAQGWTPPDSITRLTVDSETSENQLYGAAPDVPSLLARVLPVQQRFGT